MGTVAAIARFVAGVAVVTAGVCALAGFLIAHFGGLGPAGQGVGWGMCIGGAMLGLVGGQSGSPTRMAVEGRWGFFGQYWGKNPSLPQSSMATVVAALLVFAAGMAVIVLTY